MKAKVFQNACNYKAYKLAIRLVESACACLIKQGLYASALRYVKVMYIRNCVHCNGVHVLQEIHAPSITTWFGCHNMKQVQNYLHILYKCAKLYCVSANKPFKQGTALENVDTTSF